MRMRVCFWCICMFLILGSTPMHTNIYNKSSVSAVPFVVDDAKYSFLEVLEDGDLWGMDLFLYETSRGFQGIVRFAEGTYLRPEIVTVNIDKENNISLKTLHRYGFKGKISQYQIFGELLYNDGEHYRDVVMNRKLVTTESLYLDEDRSVIPIDGEFMDLSFNSKGEINGTRIRIINNEKGWIIPYIQFADGNLGEIYQGDNFVYNGNNIAFEINNPKSKYKKVQAGIYCNHLIAKMISNDGTSSTLTLLRH